MSYTVVADFNIYGKMKECLVCVCPSKESAMKTALDLRNNPNNPMLQGGLNPRVVGVSDEDSWWNHGGLD